MIRAAPARSVTEATEYVVERGAVECVPLIGAAGGVAINLIFQDMARGHFIVRRLERTYSPEIVKAEYLRL